MASDAAMPGVLHAPGLQRASVVVATIVRADDGSRVLTQP
jgi:hypothetical protein